MSRKSRPKSPFLSYIMGQPGKQLLPNGVPNCPNCKAARQEVKREALPGNIWAESLAPLWEMMVEQNQSPAQIAYCAKCDEYGILGGWSEF